MADKIDQTAEREERLEELQRKYHKPYEVPAGEPGECELCGEWSGRLVDGACAPCRDRYAKHHCIPGR